MMEASSLPTAAEFSFIAVNPFFNLHGVFSVLPAEERRTSVGVVRVPRMAWSMRRPLSETVFAYRFEEVDGKFSIGTMRLPNVARQHGAVCMGVGHPKSLRAAVQEYWSSPFNADLNVCPRCNREWLIQCHKAPCPSRPVVDAAFIQEALDGPTGVSRPVLPIKLSKTATHSVEEWTLARVQLPHFAVEKDGVMHVDVDGREMILESYGLRVPTSEEALVS